MFILCVIIIIVILNVWFILFNKFKIEFVVVGFKVFVVLLYNNILGCVINVFVMVICCFCLFDNLFGNWFFLLVSFINFNILLIFFLIFFLFVLFKISGIVIFL